VARRRTLTRRDLDHELAGLKKRIAEITRLADAGRPERIARARAEYGFFRKTYFPHLGDDDTNAFHHWVDENAPVWGPGDRMEIAAPRGNAKTSLLTRVYTLWRIARGDVHNVIIISDTLDQSKLSIEAVKLELEENPRITDDFPEICGPGRIWQAEVCTTKNGIRLMAAGAGKRIRGLNYRGKRPDLILLDDLENDDNVKTKDQRNKLEHWFTHTVLFLGPPDHSEQILYVGTFLHYDSLMARIRKRGDFRFVKFRALVTQPDRMDLWDEWERLWRGDETRDKAGARAFYDAMRAEMDRGAAVLWPGVQPLYRLMVERATDRNSFNAELQNEPMDEESRIFDPARFHFWVQRPPLLVHVGGVDPALGKERGDPTGIQILGRDPATNKVYDIESIIRRMPPMRAIGTIIALQREYRCVRWGIEEVAFQEFFKDILVAEGLKARTPVPAIGVPTGGVGKDIRIESLAPHIENGVLLLDRAHTALLQQLEYYPIADHDDGPDALEIAFRIAYTAARIEFQARPDRRGAGYGKERGF